jgi:predicted kinase
MLVQMHGEPGSGKSKLARELGRRLPAVVIDKDILKSAVLRAGGEEALAGPASYEAFFSLAASLLAQGFAVILDSPCGWPSIEARGREVAAGAGVPWAMVECVCPESTLDERLAARVRLESQPLQRRDWYARPGTRRPDCERAVVETTLPLAECADAALAHLRAVAAGRLAVAT